FDVLDLDPNGIRYFPTFLHAHSHVRSNCCDVVFPFLRARAEYLANLCEVLFAAVLYLVLAQPNEAKTAVTVNCDGKWKKIAVLADLLEGKIGGRAADQIHVIARCGHVLPPNPSGSVGRPVNLASYPSTDSALPVSVSRRPVRP